MIYGQRLRLRAPEREDIPRFVAWLNDPEVRAGLTLTSHFLKRKKMDGLKICLNPQ